VHLRGSGIVPLPFRLGLGLGLDRVPLLGGAITENPQKVRLEFVLSFLPAEAIVRIFGTVKPLPNLSPSWNVAPTQGATVVRRHPDTGGPTSIC
jgi:hypothetical protein